MKFRLLPILALVVGSVAGLPAGAEDEATKPLDFAFYKERVAPIVHGICAECHANPRKRLGRHFLRPMADRTIRERDHERNFETIRGLIEAGNPAASPWLLKPLGPGQGGVEHGGGARIRMDSLPYGTMIDFINGATLPDPDRTAATPPPAPPLPEVEADGLTVEAKAFERRADGTRETRFRTKTPGVYVIALTSSGAGATPLLAIDDGDLVAAPGPTLLLDGIQPLTGLRGDVRVEDKAVALRGRHDRASAFLLAGGVAYTGVEADVVFFPEADGGDDAALLFDMDDASNGKFLALRDGGRRIAMGLLEGGVPRVLASEKLSPADDTAPTRRLRVDVLEGIAIGRIDGRAVVFLNIGARPEAGRVGFRTHGAVTVQGLTLSDRWVVHETAFREVSGAVLTAGEHRIRLSTGPDTPALGAVTIRPLCE